MPYTSTEWNWSIRSTDLRNQPNWQHLLGVKFSIHHDCISVYQSEYFNWCEIFVIASFHSAAWVIIRALLVRRFYNRMYEWFPPHLTLVINHKLSKASTWPKSFYFSITYPTMNPTYPPWLITKSSRFIHSNSCMSPTSTVGLGFVPLIVLSM